MNHSKTNALIAAILIIQVVLSLGLVIKINSMDKAIIDMEHRLDVIRNGIGTLFDDSLLDVPMYVEGVSIDNDPSLGNEQAAVIVIEFGDFECPYCAEAEETVGRLLQEYGDDMLFVFRDFPLETIHPHAFKAAEASHCAAEQDSYWEMHDLLFTKQALDDDSLRNYARELELNIAQFDACLSNGYYDEEIRHDIEDGLEYQVSSVPTFFINGHRVLGGIYEQMHEIIETELRGSN